VCEAQAGGKAPRQAPEILKAMQQTR